MLKKRVKTVYYDAGSSNLERQRLLYIGIIQELDVSDVLEPHGARANNSKAQRFGSHEDS
jgi:hypothetical protein